MKNLIKLGIATIIVLSVSCKGRATRGSMDSTLAHPTDSSSTSVDTITRQDTARPHPAPAKK